jgi:epsilon-lactone hydrolase
MSWQLTTLNLFLRTAEKALLARMTDPLVARERLESQALLFPVRPGLRFRDIVLAPAVPGLRLVADERDGLLVWLHGGAFIMGSPLTHRGLVGALARRLGFGAVLPAYRLAPEHPFPAAVEDCRAAWEAILSEGIAPERIVLGGDSAGGGLVFSLLHELLREGRPLPGCVVGFSPWADLTLSGDSLFRLSSKEVLLPSERLPAIRDTYLRGADPRDPRASPIFGDFAGAPPALIQASLSEILLDDSRALARRFAEQGEEAALDLQEGMPHAWQIYQGWLPEADAALDRAAAWIRGVRG